LVIFQKRVPELTALALSRFVARARKLAGVKGRVDVLVTADAEMKSLNRNFRGKDKATDVLSFPAARERVRHDSAGHNSVGSNSAGLDIAGEIAISAEIAAKNARLLGHSLREEVKILVLHGILHLRGYDHERDSGQMARREHALRSQLGLPDGLIERASNQSRSGRGKLADKGAGSQGSAQTRRSNRKRSR
jgi:probable rRNA maturation factor